MRFTTKEGGWGIVNAVVNGESNGIFYFDDVQIMLQETPTHCQPLGDIDCSGKVNALDLSSLLSVFGTSEPNVDLDDSGKVNALDVSILLGNFGKSR